MKAPDKICVAPHQIFDYDLEIQEVGHNGAEEYIRKDALLEWAREKAKDYKGTANTRRSFEMMIRKIESL